MMMKLSKRERVLLVILGVVLVFGLYFTLFFNPWMQRVTTLEEQYAQNDATLQQINTKVSSLPRLQQDTDTLRAQTEALLENIPASLDESQLTLYIQQVIGQAARQVQISYTGNTTQEHYAFQQVSVRFAADYNDVRRILTTLETGAYRNHIVSMEIAPAKQVEGQPFTYDTEVSVVFNHVYRTGGTDKPTDAGSLPFGKPNPFQDTATVPEDAQ
nr:type II secretion system protein GspM [Maliibacterium massiliense]